MKDEIKFKEYMATLCEIYDRSLSRLLTDLYWKILEPFTDQQCESAFKEIIYSSRFFPKPADFIEVLQGTKKTRATEAWLEALETLKRIGNYESVKFADEAIHSVIMAMGGWPEFCMMGNDEVKWKQKEFERLYEIIVGRGGDHPVYLPGISELNNFSAGHDVKTNIVHIGFDKKKARMIQ